ncbi:hypothetical protein Nepgr_003370 [Nepenthes gracilis]|uniref:Response regulatory domain-containing protein n=1 Tax=Nepenthes gracilis TaxID=150966 RepID=A0AAD3XDS9_NEPGR|nr:hypothetical protein Nepgr_003370 [Nepenthes gracilis]
MEAFPAGLRVLVVDDELAWLKILEKMLKKCSYEVTTCGLAREALKLLRERKDGFDIVISDVNMPDMDGFKLLEHVGLEMDLPVIMMSVDGETSRVMKGVQHGACDYLLKPIRMKELRNIWQHVLRKRMHEVRDIESHEGIEDIQLFRNGTEHSDDGHFLSGGDQTSGKKRKDVENKHDDKDSGDSCSTKKPRVVWSVDLHQKFVQAVNQIGFEKVGPKKILDLMNVPWLSRENVASHLQKYRLYLSRLQKENELKTTCGGISNLDYSSGSFGLQNSTSTQQSDSANINIRCNGDKLPFQTVDSESHEIDLKCINLSPLTDPPKPYNTNISVVHRASGSSSGLNCSFGSLESGIPHAPLDSPITAQYPWCQEVPEMHFKHESNLNHQLENCFNNPELCLSQQIIHGNLVQPTTCTASGHSSSESNNECLSEIKLLSAKHNSKDIRESFPLDSKSNPLNPQALQLIANTTFDIKNRRAGQSSIFSLESDIEIKSDFGSLSDDSKFYWLQRDNFTTNLGFDNAGFSDYFSPEIITDVPIPLFGAPNFDYEYLCDSLECPVVDQGLFIA